MLKKFIAGMGTTGLPLPVVLMVASDPLIEIIIPNWNGAAMLAHCLDSLGRQSWQNFSITVVDNGSTDHSLELLREQHKDVKVISLNRNHGFSVAVNRGIKDSIAPWILLLNNDMEVAPDCLEHLASGISLYDQCDFFALKMLSFHNRHLIDGAGDAMLRGGVGYRLGTLEADGERFSEDKPSFGACAGAALYSREFFDRTGCFDPDFFAYLEDVDLNVRARRLGLHCMFLSRALVYHIGSATSGSKINKMTIRLSTRNNINLLVKNYSLSLLLRFAPAILVYQFMWFIFCLKKMMLIPYVKGIFQAITMFCVFYPKRKKILAEVSGDDNRRLGDLITLSEGQAVASIMARREGLGKNNLLLDWYRRLFL